jgi:hypothetical protein
MLKTPPLPLPSGEGEYTYDVRYMRLCRIYLTLSGFLALLA